ncbi:ribonuclease HII [Bacteroidota bacterium]
MLKSYYYNVIEAGCDEAGRGCLAGPVFAAAVILPKDFSHAVINDSKQLSEKIRNELREEIQEKAISWAIGEANHEEIDKINILNASYLAMHRALEKLSVKPEHIIIDGNRFKKFDNTPHTCIVKGDSKYYSIAAASILAKTYRDDFMMNIHDEFPEYDWLNNKGYPTKKHKEAINADGISTYHRKSYNLYNNQLKIDF